MPLFLQLELPYIVIGVFFLAVTAFVTTRDFMPKVAFKRGMIGIFSIFTIMILAHYYMTTSRMDGVKKAFNEGKTIICENKMRRTISQSVLLSKKLGWRLDGDLFKSKNAIRDFHTARCIEYITNSSKESK